MCSKSFRTRKHPLVCNPSQTDHVQARVHLRISFYHSRVSPGKREPSPAPSPAGRGGPKVQFVSRGLPSQIIWQTCSLDREKEVASFHTLQARPLAQSQRWKISRPCEPFLRCFVHTSPWRSTGLQIFVQKWRAQQWPSEQSEDRRQGSPSWPRD